MGIHTLRPQNLVESMNLHAVDALIYPSWSTPPRLLGDYADADRAPHTPRAVNPSTPKCIKSPLTLEIS